MSRMRADEKSNFPMRPKVTSSWMEKSYEGVGDERWELAVAVSKRLSFVAGHIAASKARPGKTERVLGQLAAHLLMTSDILDRPSVGQQDVLWERLDELLADLTRLCTCSNRSGWNIYCLFESPYERYPLLKVLSTAQPDSDIINKLIRPSLICFAAFPSRMVKTLFHKLKNLATAQGVEHREETESTAKLGRMRARGSFVDPDDYPSHVNQSLYKALYRHTQCACSGSTAYSSRRRHSGKLRLRGENTIREEDVLFDVIYSKENPGSTQATNWQQLQVQIPSTKPRSRVVKIASDARENDSQDEVHERSISKTSDSSRIPKGEFCSLLNKPLGPIRICLKVVDNELHQLHNAERIEQELDPGPGLSLSKALQDHRFSTKMRIVFAYILARSVWQFYDSDWMRTPWTSDSINFMFERAFDSDGGGKTSRLYASRPYYTFQFDRDSTVDEYCPMSSILHRYPRILALGNILVDIGRKTALGTNPEQYQNVEARINADWALGMTALDDKKWPAFDFSSSSPLYQSYRELVRSCFDRNVHSSMQRDTDKTIYERREFIFKNVVQPLKELLVRMKWEEAIKDIEPMDAASTTSEIDPVRPKIKVSSTVEYTVGWVCALPIEMAAAEEMLDEQFGSVRGAEGEDLYRLGKIADHYVVIGCLPAGQTGTNSAAVLAERMRLKFPSLRFGLLVGVGGGVPSGDADIRLGDVVISQPSKGKGGVIQYDFGTTTPGGFSHNGFLSAPPRTLLSALSAFRSDGYREKLNLHRHMSTLLRLSTFSPKNAGPDILFQPEYDHKYGPTCQACSKEEIVPRPQRKSGDITIHYGTIASGNQVIRDARTRDSLSEKLGGVLCFEMEAAGLMNSFPCLVFRGICDYADSHKNKGWQPYASLTAAACAKEFLCRLREAEVTTTESMG